MIATTSVMMITIIPTEWCYSTHREGQYPEGPFVIERSVAAAAVTF